MEHMEKVNSGVKRCKYKYDAESGYFFVYTPNGVKIPYQVWSRALSIVGEPGTVRVEANCICSNTIGPAAKLIDDNVVFGGEEIPCEKAYISTNPGMTGGIVGEDQDIIRFWVKCDVE